MGLRCQQNSFPAGAIRHFSAGSTSVPLVPLKLPLVFSVRKTLDGALGGKFSCWSVVRPFGVGGGGTRGWPQGRIGLSREAGMP